MVQGKWFPVGSDISEAISIRERVFGTAADGLDAAAQQVVVYREGLPVGSARLWWADGAFRLGALGVLAEERGKGYGRQLTEALMQYLSNLGASYATLEVRKSNIRAQNLYKSLGFIQLGVRKRYYEDNNEDALLMVCQDMPQPEEDFEDIPVVPQE